MSPALYTINDAAERLHKSKRWLQNFLRGRDIGRLAGRTRLFTEADIGRLCNAILYEAESRIGNKNFRKHKQGYVYFIKAGDFVKIGYTQSPVDRIKRLLTDSPLELKILHHEPGTFKQEKVLHKRFAQHRIRGEWFKLSDEIRAYLDEVKGK